MGGQIYFGRLLNNFWRLLKNFGRLLNNFGRLLNKFGRLVKNFGVSETHCFIDPKVQNTWVCCIFG